MENVTQLIYNADTGRIECDGYGLHCGNGLSVLIVDNEGQPKWVDTRIECDNGRWYLVGWKDYEVAGLFAKMR